MIYNKLIPELSVSDFEKSLQFYLHIGFKIEYKREETNFAMISLQGNQIMIEEINNNWNTGKLEKPYGRGINLQIEVDNIQTILNKLKKNNYDIFVKPKENWYRQNEQLLGTKEFLIKDPDGYLLRFSQSIGTKSNII